MGFDQLRLTILSGLPASGKSTRARSLVEAAKAPTIRVNKDSLREMLHAGRPWSREQEEITRSAQFAIAARALANGVSVIVDDTNLGWRHQTGWAAIADDYGVTLEIDFVNTPFEECVRRDSVRGDARVGRTVIAGMARQYLSRKYDGVDVIFDLDGTLADSSHRMQARDQEDFDWDAAAAGIPNDKPIPKMIEVLMEHHRSGHRIIYMTGREESCRQLTEEWLRHHGLYEVAEMLVMRATGDRRPAPDVKLDMLERYCDPAQVSRIYDDDPLVVAFLRQYYMPHVELVGAMRDGIKPLPA
jgi:predicted kinase